MNEFFTPPSFPSHWIRYWHLSLLIQVVATVGEELVSVFDGITRYAIGRWTLGKHAPNGWPPMSSCFFAHQAESKVRMYPLPHLRQVIASLWRVNTIGAGVALPPNTCFSDLNHGSSLPETVEARVCTLTCCCGLSDCVVKHVNCGSGAELLHIFCAVSMSMDSASQPQSQIMGR